MLPSTELIEARRRLAATPKKSRRSSNEESHSGNRSPRPAFEAILKNRGTSREGSVDSGSGDKWKWKNVLGTWKRVKVDGIEEYDSEQDDINFKGRQRPQVGDADDYEDEEGGRRHGMGHDQGDEFDDDRNRRTL